MTSRQDAVAEEARRMTREQVIRRALEGKINWEQAASICRLTARHLRRLRAKYERLEVLPADGRRGRAMPRRIPKEVVDRTIELRRERYTDWSLKHFHERLVERHKLAISYSWLRVVMVHAGLHEMAASRGKYRRQRERRPMCGMLIHCDGSTHEWIAGLPPHDLVAVLDDADTRLLFARFFEQEGTWSTLIALDYVVRRYGRFCEFYTDRGSHFRSIQSQHQEEADGQVARVLKTLGIRHIQALTPQARGRGERFFETAQGRWPQELRDAGIRCYEAANRYVERHLIADYNRRFTVEPAEPESAFVPLVGIDLRLLMSIQHERVVQNDHTVRFEGLVLQLPPPKERLHYVRCPVLVHELLDGTLGISFQGKLLARYDRCKGQPLPLSRAARTARGG
jgi:transposase